MRKTLEDGIATMQTALHKNNAPPGVYLAFINIIRRATRYPRECKEVTCSHGTQAMDCQDTPRTLTIIHSHLHIEWTTAIASTYKRRISPPGTDPKIVPKDKTPLELTMVLLTTV